jgi:hypothetical protein
MHDCPPPNPVAVIADVVAPWIQRNLLLDERCQQLQRERDHFRTAAVELADAVESQAAEIERLREALRRAHGVIAEKAGGR